MKCLLPVLIFISLGFKVHGQQNVIVNEFNVKINKAKKVEQKIDLLNQLAKYYYVYKLDSLARHCLDSALAIGLLSGDRNMHLKACFADAIQSIYSPNSWTKKETYNYAIDFLNNSIACAEKGEVNWNYKVIGHIRLAGIYRKRGWFEDAQKNIAIADQYLTQVNFDSIATLFYIEKGDIEKETGNVKSAYENYSIAFKRTIDIKNIRLRSEIYHHFFELFSKVGDEESAAKQLEDSRDLNIEYKNDEGLCFDYIDLARLKNDEAYIKKAETLANKTKVEYYKLYVKKLWYSYYFRLGDKNKILNYVSSNADLMQYYKNAGSGLETWNSGNIFYYTNQYDKAIEMYQLSEKRLLDQYEDNVKMVIFEVIGNAFADKAAFQPSNVLMLDTAISYSNKAFIIAKFQKDTSALNRLTETLAGLYAKQKKYDSAYLLSIDARKYKEQLSKSASKDKIALMSADNDERVREDKEYQKILTKYLFITLSIVCIFFFLLLLGVFRVSNIIIKTAGYLAFISLFEFFVLLIDFVFHDKWHLDPIWIWIAKVAIIALMVPFQHSLEHKMVAFLNSSKMLEVKKYFTEKRAKKTLIEPSDQSNEQIEEDNT